MFYIHHALKKTSNYSKSRNSPVHEWDCSFFDIFMIENMNGGYKWQRILKDLNV